LLLIVVETQLQAQCSQ